MFIVFEGIDGAGTTTQAAKIADYLRHAGHKTIIETREPSDRSIGQLIRKRLMTSLAGSLAGGDDSDRCSSPRIDLDEACNALLFAADRLDHLNNRIRPALRDGGIVICDRYVYSSLAYQAISLPMAWIRTINDLALRNSDPDASTTTPDLCFYLNVAPDIAKQRRTARGGESERYDDSALQQKIATQYDQLFIRNSGIDNRSDIISADKLHIIDASRSIDQVFEQIRTVVDKKNFSV